MFRFLLGRIPVEVHPSHFFVSGLIAWSFLPRKFDPGVDTSSWPLRSLADPTASDHVTTQIAYVAIWMGIVFISVLVHELGHAVVSRVYGYRPSIHLVWLGGHTNPNAGETIPWHRDVLLTLAGPAFGLLLAAVCFVGSLVLGSQNEVLSFTLQLAATANVFWSVLNLLPIAPLDGGRVVNAVLLRGFGRRGFIAGQAVALLLAVAGVAWGAAHDALGLMFFFGFVGMTSFAMLTRALRGDPIEPRHPYDLGFEEATSLYRAGKPEGAKKLALSLLAADPAPSETLQSRAHHLLGWIELKDGAGREALEHFSKVTNLPVEPHALAAAFSLVGDDERALALWEVAWKNTGDRTVLHEYAGTLLRTRGVEAVQQVPGVELALAHTCAVRLLSIRGDFLRAGQLAAQGSEGLVHFQLAYDGACAFARGGDRDSALRLLERAGEQGFRDWDYAASDADLDVLHRDARFASFLERMKESRVG